MRTRRRLALGALPPRTLRMRLRRCAIVCLESREELEFDLKALTDGASGLRESCQWVALLPPANDAVALSGAEVAALGEFSPSKWRDPAGLDCVGPVFDSLLAKGLLVVEGSPQAARDEQLRSKH